MCDVVRERIKREREITKQKKKHFNLIYSIGMKTKKKKKKKKKTSCNNLYKFYFDLNLKGNYNNIKKDKQETTFFLVFFLNSLKTCNLLNSAFVHLK